MVMMEASFVRLLIWFFAFVRLITVQKVIDDDGSPNITVIEFFKSQYHSNGHDAVVKQIGLADTVYFEIVDHFGKYQENFAIQEQRFSVFVSDTPEYLLNWPINCWITLNETKNSENATKFIKNG